MLSTCYPGLSNLGHSADKSSPCWTLLISGQLLCINSQFCCQKALYSRQVHAYSWKVTRGRERVRVCVCDVSGETDNVIALTLRRNGTYNNTIIKSMCVLLYLSRNVIIITFTNISSA